MQKGQNKYNKKPINYQIKDNLENILILSFHSQQMFYKAVSVIKGILRTFLIAVFTTKMFLSCYGCNVFQMALQCFTEIIIIECCSSKKGCRYVDILR